MISANMNSFVCNCDYLHSRFAAHLNLDEKGKPSTTSLTYIVASVEINVLTLTFHIIRSQPGGHDGASPSFSDEERLDCGG